MDKMRGLFLLRVHEGRRDAVLQAALGLRVVRDGAVSGLRELMLLTRPRDPPGLGRAAERLMALDGVESVDLATVAPAEQAGDAETPTPADGTYL